MHLAVSELFGPTVQGEGPALGQPAIFLRLMGCNLRCSWCDTPYTWDGSRYDLAKQTRRMPLEDVAERVRGLMAGDPMLLVITGGEPMLQQGKLVALLDLLPAGQAVHIETAGTVASQFATLDSRVKYTVSLKLAHSGNAEAQRRIPVAITQLRDSGAVLAWKFVLRDEADYDEVDMLVKLYRLRPVWVMAEGTDSQALAERMRHLLPGALARGYAVTPRLHIDMHGSRRGV